MKATPRRGEERGAAKRRGRPGRRAASIGRALRQLRLFGSSDDVTDDVPPTPGGTRDVVLQVVQRRRTARRRARAGRCPEALAAVAARPVAGLRRRRGRVDAAAGDVAAPRVAPVARASARTSGALGAPGRPACLIWPC